MYSLSRSPPRTGTIAFTPAPAKYAPATLRQRTAEPGNAAAGMFRHARVRTATFARWQSSANSTGVHAIARRWSMNAVKAWRTSLIERQSCALPPIVPTRPPARSASELGEDLGVLGEAVLLLLREEERVAVEHVELALSALDRLRGAARLRCGLGT